MEIDAVYRATEKKAAQTLLKTFIENTFGRWFILHGFIVNGWAYPIQQNVLLHNTDRNLIITFSNQKNKNTIINTGG